MNNDYFSKLSNLVSRGIELINSDAVFEDVDVIESIISRYNDLQKEYNVSDIEIRLSEKMLDFVIDDIDFRNPNYYKQSLRFVNDIKKISDSGYRPVFIFDICLIILYIRLKNYSDNFLDQQHIYNLILNFLSEYRSNVSDDRCLLKVWYMLSELGYIQESDTTYYVRSLKRNVYSIAHDLFGEHGGGLPRSIATSTDGDYKDLVIKLRYRSGIRVDAIIDVSNRQNCSDISMYEILEFIHCDDIASIARDYSMNQTAIADKLSTTDNYTAIAAMLSTDNDQAVIGVIQSTYGIYYNLLRNILNNLNLTGSIVYDEIESVLVKSISILSQTRSFDMKLICLVILEILKRLPLIQDVEDDSDIRQYKEQIDSYDECCYSNNPACLRSLLNDIERVFCKSMIDVKQSTMTSQGRYGLFDVNKHDSELSQLESMAGFLTEGFQVIPHTEFDRNLGGARSLIEVSLFNLGTIYQELPAMLEVANASRNNCEEINITRNISIMSDIIKVMANLNRNEQIVKSIDVLRKNVSSDRIALSKLDKAKHRALTHQSLYTITMDDTSNNIVILL